jgi:hypothetical protein
MIFLAQLLFLIGNSLRLPWETIDTISVASSSAKDAHTQKENDYFFPKVKSNFKKCSFVQDWELRDLVGGTFFCSQNLVGTWAVKSDAHLTINQIPIGDMQGKPRFYISCV